MIRSLILLLFAFAAAASIPGATAASRSTTDLDTAIGLFMGRDYQGALVSLEAVVAEDPESADAHAWLAEVHRRLRDPDSAFAEASRAIELEPCHAFGYNILGELHTEMYGSTRYSDDERAWECFWKAAECDPSDGSPWLTIWSLAMSRGDEKAEETAIRQMYETDFFTPAAYEFARWLLRDLPENAVLLTNGDMDTYPLLAIQAGEGIRTDVTVVNYSLLNTDFFPAMCADRTGYPMPEAELSPYRRSDDYLAYKSSQIVHYWIENLDALPRPLVIGITVADHQITPNFEDHLQLAGGYFLYLPSTGHDRTDSALVWKSLKAVDTKAVLGPMASAHDRSPVRHGPGLHDNLVSVAIRAAIQDAESGEQARAIEILDWAEAFYADLPADLRGGHDFQTDLEDLRQAIESGR